AADLNLRAISAASFIPHLPPRSSEQPAPDAMISTETHRSEEQPLPANHYIVTLEGEPLEIDSPLAGHHQQRNIALAIAAAVELRNSEGYKLGQIDLKSNQKSYK